MIRRPATLALCLAAGLAAADEPIPHRQDRPPNRPYSPAEAIERMTVPEGFAVELVASEPDIVNPVAMTFDDRGRIWVAESLEYPRREAGPGRDRIQILEDSDGDGRADRFTVFAAGLNIPTGIAVGHGGAWVLNAPDLLFLEEKDGKEVRREVVVTGFGRTDTHELPNSLTWGPDGWLYGLNGVFNKSRVVSGGREFAFTCALFRVHPRTRQFEVVCEGTSNPWGLAWDTEGSALVSACHWAKDHLFHFVETGYYQRQAGAYPPYTLRIGSITNHGHQKTAYCGLAYLDSDAYPEPYRERLYMGNIHGGCINVDSLRRDGSTYISEAEPDFLSSNDAWFMPVSQKVGPDGCLYILDWYDRYHCYQDAGRDPAGIDRLRGRLYRVRYGDSPRAPRFDLARESDEQLIERLSSPNIFFRESAQRLLAERSTPAVRARLEDLLLDGSAPRKGRMHGLWALIGGGALRPGFHLKLLSHPEPAYRAWGVRAAGNAGKVDPALRERVAAMVRDPSPDVQLQAAIAARKVEGLDPLPLLIEVLARSGADKLIPSIVWPNLHPLLEKESDRFTRLVQPFDLNVAPGLADTIPRAVERILDRRDLDLDSVRALLELLASRDPGRAKQTLAALSRRIGEYPGTLQGELRARFAPLLERILSGGAGGPLHASAMLLAARLGIGQVDVAAVRGLFLSEEQPETARLQALDALIAFRDQGLAEVVGKVLDAGKSSFLVQVLALLGGSGDPKVADLLLARYPGMDPELQPLAVELLLQREPWARKLLDAVRSGKLPRGVLGANHLRKILESNDREAVWAVEKGWGVVRAERNPEQERVVAEMAASLRKSPGDALAGEQVFRKLCGQCHRIYGEGKDVGPDLTTNGRASFEQLVSNVFDPSLVIGPGYQVITVVTVDGRNLTGIPVEDSERGMVLKLAGGEQVAVARNAIKHSRPSTLSMMPEGIEKTLDPKEIADLFAFLGLDRHPADPLARLIPGAPALPAR
ncbi:MAG TPA: PVC-type heme-binding CxxCH protein [Planctomycetota bacterium]|nr:PVC-type heme-binding CxxCH protein [Planctomycetota bacterium]